MKPAIKTIGLTLLVGTMFFGIIFMANPFLFFGSGYKTQEVIYRYKENPNIRIEFQMEDMGAFGYNRRIVKVTPILFFNNTAKIDTTQIDQSKWSRVDEYVNKLGLKFP